MFFILYKDISTKKTCEIKIYLQSVLEKLSMSENGYFLYKIENTAINIDLQAIQITNPLNKEVIITILYVVVLSILVGVGLPPKLAVKEVHRKQMASRTAMEFFDFPQYFPSKINFRMVIVIVETIIMIHKSNLNGDINVFQSIS